MVLLIVKDFLKNDCPNVQIGDNIKVGVKIIEGNKERVRDSGERS